MGNSYVSSSPSGQPLPNQPGRKWIFAAIIVSIALASFAVYRLSGPSAIEKLEISIKQRGEPLTLADLAATYPPIQDKDNGAVLLLKEWEKEWPSFWGAFRQGQTSLPQRSDPQLDVALPFRGANASTVSRTVAVQQTNITAMEVYLKEEKEHLDAIRAALRFSKFRFPVQITNGFEALVPHLGEIKKEAQSFRVVGLLAVERNDVEAAINALDDTYRAGKALASEPFLIGQLVRLSCYAMVLEDMERLLSRQSLSASQLERLRALLEQLRMPGALRCSFLAERASDLSAFNPSNLASQPISQLGMGVWRATGLRDADKRLLLETMRDAILLADREDPKALKQFAELFQNTSLVAKKFPPKLLSSMLLPSLEKVPAKFAALEARRRAATVAIAVELYRMSYGGHLPETLDNLVPQFLPGIPQDPFDGQSLRFHPLKTGFVVYSVGRDLIDHGGKERPKKAPMEDFDEIFVIER